MKTGDALTKEVYWLRRAQCDLGKHKLRDNKFGVTWCVTCGFLSTKPCGVDLTEEDLVITTNLK